MGKNIVWERIESLINRENISAYKLGKDTGISTASLTDWKKGRSSPKFDKLKAIADYFGVSVYYLTGEVDDFDSARQQKIAFIKSRGGSFVYEKVNYCCIVGFVYYASASYHFARIGQL